MASLEAHVDFARCRDGFAFSASTLSAGIRRRELPVTETANLADEPHPGCGAAFTAHTLTLSEEKVEVIHTSYTIEKKSLTSDIDGREQRSIEPKDRSRIAIPNQTYYLAWTLLRNLPIHRFAPP